MANQTKPITPKNMEKLAVQLIRWLIKHDCFSDVCIYTKDTRFSSSRPRTCSEEDIEEVKLKNGVYYKSPADVTQIVEYNNPDTLTVTFEGPLYDLINHNSYLESGLCSLFLPYGLYYEQGYSWSFALYSI